MSNPYKELTELNIKYLVSDYDSTILRYADDNGVLPEARAVEAAEIAHSLYAEYSDLADHYLRLAREHREGR